MFVIPSIDILNGKCVQLENGKIITAKYYGSPEKYLQKWISNGADLIHIIDLDAVLKNGSNKKLIFKLIKKSDVNIQVGGGIRNEKYAYELIENGAYRVIIGSKAFDKNFLKNLKTKIPKNQIMVALDTKKGIIVSDGWQKKTGIKYRMGINK